MRYLIAHAPHAPGRRASLARLLEQFRDGDILASQGPEHASIWARRIWERAASIDDHVCILNDDVRILPGGLEYIARAVEAVPDECISLHSSNPNVAAFPDEAWLRCYHYSGPGVVLPPGAAADLLDFVYRLPWSLVSRVNEDVLGIAWAWARQRPFWYLLPSPITHDTSVPSTLGYDHHPNRVPVDMGGPPRELTVTNRDAVPLVELPWSDTRALRYRREVLRAERALCVLCVGREGVVGDVKQGVMLCLACLHELNNAAVSALR